MPCAAPACTKVTIEKNSLNDRARFTKRARGAPSVLEEGLNCSEGNASYSSQRAGFRYRGRSLARSICVKNIVSMIKSPRMVRVPQKGIEQLPPLRFLGTTEGLNGDENRIDAVQHGGLINFQCPTPLAAVVFVQQP